MEVPPLEPNLRASGKRCSSEVLGPVIDNVAEPRFRTLAPTSGESPSPAFLRGRQRCRLLELVATGLSHVIGVMWILT